jgi:hypothetical protein
VRRNTYSPSSWGTFLIHTPLSDAVICGSRLKPAFVEPLIDRRGFVDGIRHVVNDPVVRHAAQVQSQYGSLGARRPELRGVSKSEHADP